MFLGISMGNFQLRFHLKLNYKITFQLESNYCFLTGSVNNNVTVHGRIVLDCVMQLFKTCLFLKRSSFTWLSQTVNRKHFKFTFRHLDTYSNHLHHRRLGKPLKSALTPQHNPATTRQGQYPAIFSCAICRPLPAVQLPGCWRVLLSPWSSSLPPPALALPPPPRRPWPTWCPGLCPARRRERACPPPRCPPWLLPSPRTGLYVVAGLPPTMLSPTLLLAACEGTPVPKAKCDEGTSSAGSHTRAGWTRRAAWTLPSGWQDLPSAVPGHYPSILSVTNRPFPSPPRRPAQL